MNTTTPTMWWQQLDSLDRLLLGVPVVWLPVHWCRTCDGDRPHIATDHYATCLACGRTTL